MATYYAVCNVNGPISHYIEAESDAAAVAAFEAAVESGDARRWIDSAYADAEDDLEIEGGDGMDEELFGVALEAAGCVYVADLSPVHNAHAGTTAHLSGGWSLWRSPNTD